MLASVPTFDEFLRAVFEDCPPHYNPQKDCFIHGYSKWGAIKQVVDGLRDSFGVRELPKGVVTKKRLELLSRKLLDTQEYVKAIDENKLVVIRGRAGTGKTLKLLRIAVELAEDRAHRCLILTYNHALVADVRRLLAFHGAADRDEKAVNIMTLHGYFYRLFVSFGLVDNGDTVLHDQSLYLRKIDELKETYALAETKDELLGLMSSDFELVAYDHVFIDEAQDWYVEERDLIRTMFQGRSIIVSDGQDQLVRHGTHCDWSAGLTTAQVHRKPPERKSVRQKRSIVRFANEFARQSDLEWALEGSDELTGGRVVIVYGELTPHIYQRVIDDLKSAQCIGYDLLVATPRGMSDPLEQILPKAYFGNMTAEGELKYLDLRSNKKKKLAKDQYISDTTTARVSYYDSLRGVEAWTLIAHSFDIFLREVESRRQDETLDGVLRLETAEEKVHRLAGLWGLIALTRPVDTLVLHLADPNSKWSQIIQAAADHVPDIIEIWSGREA